MQSNTVSQIELDASMYGIDLRLIDHNLQLSFEERLYQHEAALELVQNLIEANNESFSQLKQPSETLS